MAYYSLYSRGKFIRSQRTRDNLSMLLGNFAEVQSSRLERVMEVILGIDINESYVWQFVYQDLLLLCRFHRD